MVAVVTAGDDGEQVATVTADGDGAWSYSLDEPLSPGDHELEVTSTDEAGNEGRSDTVTVSVVVDVELVVTSPAEGDVVTSDEVVARGTARPGAEVTVSVDGQDVATVTAGADGAWQASVPVSEGDNELTVTSGDDSVTVGFTGELASSGDDYDRFVLAGGCSSAPAGGQPSDGLLALLAIGLFAWRKRRAA